MARVPQSADLLSLHHQVLPCGNPLGARSLVPPGPLEGVGVIGVVGVVGHLLLGGTALTSSGSRFLSGAAGDRPAGTQARVRSARTASQHDWPVAPSRRELLPPDPGRHPRLSGPLPWPPLLALFAFLGQPSVLRGAVLVPRDRPARGLQPAPGTAVPERLGSCSLDTAVPSLRSCG